MTKCSRYPSRRPALQSGGYRHGDSNPGTDPAALLTPEDKEAALIRCRLPIPASVLLDDRIHRQEQNWLFWSAWLLEFKAAQESRRAERRKAA